MSIPAAPEQASSDSSGAAWKALGELRRTAPETRAVLAGLLLVLGAWVGPGLQREVSGADEAEVAATTETSATPVVGGAAYTAAVQTAADPSDAEAVPAVFDQD